MQQATFNVSQEKLPEFHHSSFPHFFQSHNSAHHVNSIRQDEAAQKQVFLSSGCDWETFMNELEYE